MSKDSKIQWTDHTWNIARGCSKVDADCKFCYMFRQSLNKTRYDPAQVIRTKTVFNLPLTIKEPSKIFTSSLTDFFHEDIDSYRQEAWDIIKRCPQHTFQILTKRPERIADCLPADWNDGENYPNVWIGTSVGHQLGTYRIAEMIILTTRAFVKLKRIFLSIEPLHGPMPDNAYKLFKYFDWIIVGGESGNDTGKYRYRPCEITWIENIIDKCKGAKVPVFVKQLGTHLAKQMGLKDRHGGNIDEWPEHLKIREFPHEMDRS